MVLIAQLAKPMAVTLPFVLLLLDVLDDARRCYAEARRLSAKPP